MAKLTSNIPVISSGEPIVNPGSSGPSIFEGVAKLAGGLLEMQAGADATNLRRATAARAEAEFQQKQAARAAENDVAKAFFDVNSDIPPAMQEDVILMRDEIGKRNTAVGQGRMTAAQRDIKTQTLLRQVLARHPGQEAVVYKAMKEAGLDTPFTREYDAQINDIEAEQEAIRKGRSEAMNVAFTKLGMPTTTDPEEAIAAGQKWLAEEARMDRASKQATYVNSQMQASQSSIKFNRDQLDEELYEGTLAKASVRLGVLTQQMERIARDANNSPQALKELADLQSNFSTQVDLYIQQEALSAGARGASQTTVNNLRTQLERFRDIGKSLLVGENSQVAENAILLKDMQTRLKIDALTAFPLLAQLQEAAGGAAVGNLVADALLRDDQLREKIGKELREAKFHGFQEPEGKRHIANVVRMIQGEDLNISKTERQQIMRTAPQLYAKSAIKYRDTGDAAVGKVAVNSLKAIADAASNINFQDPDGLRFATLIMTHPNAIHLLNGMAKNSDAQLTGTVVRGVVAKSMDEWQKLPSDNNFWDVSYNRVTGRYEIVRTENKTSVEMAYSKLPANHPIRQNDPQLQITERLREKAKWLNAGLNMLTSTSKEFASEDPRFATATPKQLRQFYATGKGLPAPKEGGEPPKDWFEEVAKTRRELQKLTDNISFSDIGGGTSDLSTVPFSQIRAQVLSKESGGNYDIAAYNEPTPKPLTQMSLGEVYSFQKNELRPRTKGRRGPDDIGSTGVGAYQFESETLRQTAEKLFGKDWQKQPFSPEVQEKLAETLWMNVRGNRALANNTWAAVRSVG